MRVRVCDVADVGQVGRWEDGSRLRRLQSSCRAGLLGLLEEQKQVGAGLGCGFCLCCPNAGGDEIQGEAGQSDAVSVDAGMGRGLC